MLGLSIYWLPTGHSDIDPSTIDNMKLFLIIAAVLATTLAEAPAASGPYPPSGWKPSGRLLVLPSRQQTYGAPAPQPPASYGPPQEYGPPASEATPEAEPSDTPVDQPEGAQGDSERLVDSGVYYVLQADGKLQMVKYTTAPLKQKQSFQQQRFGEASNFNSQRVQPDKFQQQKQAQLTQVQAHQAQFQYKPAQFSQQQTQFSQQSSQFNQQSQSAQYNQQPSQYNGVATPFHYVEVQKSVELPVAQPAPEQPSTGFVANVQYRDVEPISAPIYAYNPAPLVRILKK